MHYIFVVSLGSKHTCFCGPLTQRSDPGHEGLFLSLAHDIGSALEYLHTHNPVMLHRDVKAENVLVSTGWRAKLTGFVFLRTAAAGDVANTQVGTPYWTAPEIFRAEAYGCKVDVYSFAMTLVEMLQGAAPWSVEIAADPSLTAVSIAYTVASEGGRPSIPEGVPPEVRALLIGCWDHDVSLRFDMATALRAIEKLCPPAGPVARAGPACQVGHEPNDSDRAHDFSHMFSPQDETLQITAT